MDDIARAKKNAYMKEYLRRYRQTDHGRAVQKAIKTRMNLKYSIEHDAKHLSEVAVEFVEKMYYGVGVN